MSNDLAKALNCFSIRMHPFVCTVAPIVVEVVLGCFAFVHLIELLFKRLVLVYGLCIHHFLPLIVNGYWLSMQFEALVYMPRTEENGYFEVFLEIIRY